MNEFIRKNFALVLAFVLPIVLIATVAAGTYLPSLFLSTDYNFIYTLCTDGTNYYSNRCDTYLQKRYSVVNNTLALNTINPTQDSDEDGIPDIQENYTDRIFLHDTKKNESREITLAQAQALQLNELLTSPDSVTVSSNYDTGADFFLFFNGDSSHGYYLTKGNSKSKLNLINGDEQYYYRNNFQFIGWVLPGRN